MNRVMMSPRGLQVPNSRTHQEAPAETQKPCFSSTTMQDATARPRPSRSRAEGDRRARGIDDEWR